MKEYTNELELKSILIRIKNARSKFNTSRSAYTKTDDSPKSELDNRLINKYIKWYKKVLNGESSAKARKVQADLKSRIIRYSESVCVDKKTYEKFGYIILLIIQNITKQGKFRGYSYQDDFVSDSVYRILKYLDNFDHTKVSQKSGQCVNAFAYISQIIHNSIVFVINKNKAFQDFIFEETFMKKIENGANPIVFEDVYREKPNLYVLETISNSENICSSIMKSIENNKENFKNKLFTLELKIVDYELDIDEIMFVEGLKRTYKNLKISRG